MELQLVTERRGWGFGMDYAGGQLQLMFWRWFLIIEKGNHHGS